jgi:imidazole glycerol-phosphate synthase subunit HisH
MIGVIDYGIGNNKSVLNMLRYIGVDSALVTSPDELIKYDRLILPGVGAFDKGVELLKSGGWFNEIDRLVLNEKIPILGICLGMQLQCKTSEEGVANGFGWFDAHVKKITSINVKIPHMGWSYIKTKKHSKILPSSDLDNKYYHVHSYYVVPNNNNDILATTYYDNEIVVAIECENICGLQFHPEKSHKFGMKVLANFSNF